MSTVEKIRKSVGWALACITLLLNISVSATGQDTERSSAGPAHPDSLTQAPTAYEPAGYGQPGRAPIDVKPPNGDAGLTTAKPSKDLTGFFAIGFIINILAIVAFLYWAAGQWRKKR